LLRLEQEQTRDQALPRDRPPNRAVFPARRGAALVLRGRGRKAPEFIALSSPGGLILANTPPNARRAALTPGRIRHLPEEEVGAKRLAVEAARFRELYTLLDLRVAVHENGDLDVAVGTTNTKGVMP